MNYMLILFIIFIKVLFTEIFCIGLVLISFVIRGKLLTHSNWNKIDWNTYFIHISDRFVFCWGTIMYLISSILATLIAYALFYVFDFPYPISCAMILFACCTILTWLKYLRKEKLEIIEKLSFIRQIAKEELKSNDIE